MADKTYARPTSHPRNPYYWPGQGRGTAGGMSYRRVTTLSLPVDDTVLEGTIQLEGTAGSCLLTIETDKPCWVRLYATAEDRDTDSSRDIDTLIPLGPIILDAYFDSSEGGRELIFDGDEWGAFAFNGQDPARAQLYYRIEVAAVEDFQTLFQDFSFEDGDLDFSYETPWQPLLWYDPNGTGGMGDFRSRYYEEFSQMRPSGLDAIIAKYPTPPDDRAVVQAGFNAWRSNTLDSPAFWAYHCAFLRDVPGVGGWDNAARLQAGIEREDAGHVTATIFLIDDDDTNVPLDSTLGIDLDANEDIDVKLVLARESGDVIARLYLDNVLTCEAVVPEWLTSRPQHRGIGLLAGTSDVGEAALGFGGLAISQIGVIGARARLTVHLGYVPLEVPGGTLEGVNPSGE